MHLCLSQSVTPATGVRFWEPPGSGSCAAAARPVRTASRAATPDRPAGRAGLSPPGCHLPAVSLSRHRSGPGRSGPGCTLGVWAPRRCAAAVPSGDCLRAGGRNMAALRRLTRTVRGKANSEACGGDGAYAGQHQRLRPVGTGIRLAGAHQVICRGSPAGETGPQETGR